MRALAPGERRTIGLALAVLAPALLWVWAVQPLVAALGDRRAELAAEQSALARERALLAVAPRSASVRRAIDSLRDASADRLLDAADDAIAGAQLSAYVAEVALDHRVLLTGADAQAATTTPDGVRAVPVVVRGESDYPGIVSFLRALERGAKLVRVDAVALNGPSAGDPDPKRARVVRLRATVVGFGLAPARRTP